MAVGGGAWLVGGIVAAALFAISGGAVPDGERIPVLIGPHGLATPAGLIRWRGYGPTFVGAVVRGDPPVLRVDWTVAANGARVPHHTEIPLPEGAIDDARAVAAKIAAP